MSPTTTASAQFDVGDSAPDLTLPDARGRNIAFSELWQAAPLALLFIRHFG